MTAMPRTVFKYEGFNVNSLLNLKKQSIYFGSPARFNDPFDCTITTRIQEPTSDELQEMRQCYLARDDTPEDAKRQLNSMSPRELRDSLVGSFTAIYQQQKEHFLATKGITCFSEEHDNLLMWAHYGDSYRGFCLEFRTDIEPFKSKLRRVDYVDDIPEISLVPFVRDRDASQLIEKAYCTKSRSWAYEKEWRAIHHEAGTLYKYTPDALKAVYFGPRVDIQVVDLICIILAAQNPGVDLWLGNVAANGFTIDFERKTYTPMMLGRKLGWLPQSTLLSYPPFT